ncbi:MAG: DUF1801 domain-containing protein [Anaerolineales bacterium]|nr:DUF1801 domain-containing protein [Anaerolineales bacterium]
MTTKKNAQTWSDEEKAAMRERAKEMKAEARASKNREEGEKAILSAIEKMKGDDSSLAKRIHKLVMSVAPTLMPKTWYGMPAYADADGKVICFFQAASKFGVRYATLGFQHDAKLDDGNMWATSYAVLRLTAAEEAKIKALVKQAIGA